MKTKEELLQSVYGAEYIHADINGWMKYGMYHPNDLGFDNDEIDRYGDMDLWRPKSLLGIDDNFGWISINSEKDLPSEDEFYWVFDGIGIYFSFFKSKHKEFIDQTDNECAFYNITHYQQIVKPNPPLHK